MLVSKSISQKSGVIKCVVFNGNGFIDELINASGTFKCILKFYSDLNRSIKCSGYPQ
jgi:hypothetical protein